MSEEVRSEVIEVGDVVKVDFNNAQTTLCHEAVVLGYPCATGDSWKFRNLKTNEIYYVSEGCTITRKPAP